MKAFGLSLHAMIDGWIERLRSSWLVANPRLVGADDYCLFLDRQTTFIVQKGLTQTLRARAGIFWEHVSQERRFKEDMDVGRWIAYRAVMPDLMEITAPSIVMAALRASEACDAATLRRCIGAHLLAHLEGRKLPEHGDFRSWSDYVADMAGGVTGRILDPSGKLEVGDVKALSRRCIGDLQKIPVLAALLAPADFAMLRNFLLFSYLEVERRFNERADIDALAAGLTTEASVIPTMPRVAAKTPSGES